MTNEQKQLWQKAYNTLKDTTKPSMLVYKVTEIMTAYNVITDSELALFWEETLFDCIEAGAVHGKVSESIVSANAALKDYEEALA